MSVFVSSSACFSASRFRRSASKSRALRIFQATSRFLCCERSFCTATTIPVGRWVIRTALEVLLTFWPPAPEARKVSIRTSDSFTSISISSSTSG